MYKKRLLDNKLKIMIFKDLLYFDKKNKIKSNWLFMIVCVFCYLLKVLKGFGSFWNFSNRLWESMYIVVFVYLCIKCELIRGNFFKYYECLVNIWILNFFLICLVKFFCFVIFNDIELIVVCIRGK